MRGMTFFSRKVGGGGRIEVGAWGWGWLVWGIVDRDSLLFISYEGVEGGGC